MAKLNLATESVATEAAAAVEVTHNFAQVIGDRAFPTLKAISEVLDVPPQRLYGVAKQPIAGQVYDKNVYNWGAISKFIEKRIGKEGDEYATFEEVYDAAIKRDEELGASDKRRGTRTGGGGSSKVFIDVGGGKKIPERRKPVELGDTVYLKGEKDAFKVVFMTETHVVMAVDESPVLTCLSNWTFNQKVAAGPTTEAPAAE